MIEKLVDEHEINIESFKVSATRNEFEEMVIFWMFCMTMTGWCSGKYYRDFIIDTMKLTIGYIFIGISSKETAKAFDEKFNNRWLEYKSVYDKIVVKSTEKKLGHFLEHLCFYFKENILKKEHLGFVAQLIEVMALGKMSFPTRESQLSELQSSEIGRNMSLRNIHDFFGYIDSINKISSSNKQINHLQETIQLFKLYYMR